MVFYCIFDVMNSHKTYTVAQAQNKLESYCAYQERCHKEVRQKLRDMKMIPEAIDVIMVHLIQHNFLNEERFSKAFVRGKFSIKNWGKQRIINELKFRNISTYNINTGLKEIDDEHYLKTLQKLAEKKLPLIKESNAFKKSSKLVSYLISKGFEPSLVYQVVKNITD